LAKKRFKKGTGRELEDEGHWREEQRKMDGGPTVFFKI